MALKECDNCGKLFKSEELIELASKRFLCPSCKVLDSINKIKIKILEDDIPAIIVPSTVFAIKKKFNTLRSIKENANLDFYYFQIMQKTNYSKGDLIKMVNERIDEFNGLVSEETALMMIAQDLGIKLKSKKHDL